MSKYKIIDIVHSGRKGTRGTKVTQSKYENMVGCIAYIDIDNIKLFKSVHMILKGHPEYNLWDTSVLISCEVNWRINEISLETTNSIYILEKIEE